MFSNFFNWLKNLKSILFQVFLCALVISLLFFESSSSQDIFPKTGNLKFKTHFRNRKLAAESYKQFDVKSEFLSKVLDSLKNTQNEGNLLIRKRRQLFGDSGFPISEFGYDENYAERFSTSDRGNSPNQIPNRNQFADSDPNSVITPTPELNINPLSSFNNPPFTGWPSYNPYVDYSQYGYGVIDEYAPIEGSGVYEGYEGDSRRPNNRNSHFSTTPASQTTYTSTNELFGQTATGSDLLKPTTQTTFYENMGTANDVISTVSTTEMSTTNSQNFKTNQTTFFPSLLNNNTNTYDNNLSNSSMHNILFYHKTSQKKTWVVHKRNILFSVLIPVIFILIVCGLAGTWVYFFAEKWKMRRIGVEIQPKNGNHVRHRDPATGSSARSSHSIIEVPKPNGNHVEAWSHNSYHMA